MLGAMRVLRYLVRMKNTEMTLQRDGFGAFAGAGCRKRGGIFARNSRRVGGSLFLADGAHCVHELLMKALFPVGCDFHGEHGDAVGSELVDEHR